jgi:metal-responsive CopG/Arc/MetJ family transcriptional regulator
MVCWHTVKRTTVKIPDELDTKLRHEAERRGVTISEVTREALEAYLNGDEPPNRRLSFFGIIDSGGDPVPVERQHDEYAKALEREYEEIKRSYEEDRSRRR